MKYLQEKAEVAEVDTKYSDIDFLQRERRRLDEEEEKIQAELRKEAIDKANR